VTIEPFALSSTTSISYFNYIPNIPEESGLKKRHVYNATPSEFRKISVQVKRLDDLIPDEIDISFIKIDVEGAELDVLEGALELLKRTTPIVAFECGAASFLGYHETPEKIFNIFNNLGYVIYSITGDLINDAKIFREVSYAQNYWDFIALPSSKSNLSHLLKK